VQFSKNSLYYSENIHCTVVGGGGEGQALLFFYALAFSVGKK
jgi:hypothetical protein